ncbi:MAG: PilN domain-containing protein [Oligoflexia bacterium]|nr:PilN domain-containing protein [Oligoflexia bacterium]
MIKINLARRKQASVATSGGSSGGGGVRLPSLGDLKLGISFDRFKEFEMGGPVRRAALPVIVGILAAFTLESHKASELKKLNDELAVIAEKKPLLEAEANKIKSYEALKKSLEEDEFTIRTKIDTIQKLVAGRGLTPKILVSLAAGVPEHVWFSELRLKDSQLTVQGYSITMGQVSDFMRVLGESAYFTDLNLRNSQQVKGEAGAGDKPGENAGEITSFELVAKRK